MKTKEIEIIVRYGKFNVDAIVKDGKICLNSSCGKNREKEVKDLVDKFSKLIVDNVKDV